jgi:hypothetical protein
MIRLGGLVNAANSALRISERFSQPLGLRVSRGLSEIILVAMATYLAACARCE